MVWVLLFPLKMNSDSEDIDYRLISLENKRKTNHHNKECRSKIQRIFCTMTQTILTHINNLFFPLICRYQFIRFSLSMQRTKDTQNADRTFQIFRLPTSIHASVGFQLAWLLIWTIRICWWLFTFLTDHIQASKQDLEAQFKHIYIYPLVKADLEIMIPWCLRFH